MRRQTSGAAAREPPRGRARNSSPMSGARKFAVPAKVINGVELAGAIRAVCREQVRRLKAQYGITPGLAVILVGADSPSRLYVRNKARACVEVGIRSFRFEFAADTDPGIVIEKIAELNADPAVHGILVQLPLPPQFKLARVLSAIS